MRLVDIYSVTDAADTLWRLLAEREPHQNISHRRMPTLQEHRSALAVMATGTGKTSTFGAPNSF